MNIRIVPNCSHKVGGHWSQCSLKISTTVIVNFAKVNITSLIITNSKYFKWNGISTRMYSQSTRPPWGFGDRISLLYHHACRTRRLIGGISYHSYVVWDVKEPLSMGWRSGFCLIIRLYIPINELRPDVKQYSINQYCILKAMFVATILVSIRRYCLLSVAH